jgi:hypothetical protein
MNKQGHSVGMCTDSESESFGVSCQFDKVNGFSRNRFRGGLGWAWTELIWTGTGGGIL